MCAEEGGQLLLGHETLKGGEILSHATQSLGFMEGQGPDGLTCQRTDCVHIC